MNARREAKYRASKPSFKGSKLSSLVNRMFVGVSVVTLSYVALCVYTGHPKILHKLYNEGEDWVNKNLRLGYTLWSTESISNEKANDEPHLE